MTSPNPPIRVLYIAGSGRSGSTLVTTILGQLPGFFAAGELRYLWRRGLVENRPCGCGRPVRECPLWMAVLAGVPGVDPAGLAGRLALRLRVRGLPGLLRRHRRGRPPVAAHPDDPHLARLYAAIAAHAFPAPGPAGVIVDSSKLPPYGALLGTLPELRLSILHLVRDPRATAFSWRRRRRLDGGDRLPAVAASGARTAGNGDDGAAAASGAGGAGVSGERDRLMSRPPVWKAALLWLIWNGATLRLWGETEDYLRVRYEDFVAAPAETIARIARFAGAEPGDLPFPAPGMVELAPTHSVAGNPSRHRVGVLGVVADSEWLAGLPPRAYAVVTALTVPLLGRFGYPLRRGGTRTAPVATPPSREG